VDGLVQLIRSPPVFSPLAPLAEIRKAQIVAGREQRAKAPSQANNYLDTLRALFKWAIAAELVKKDPTQGVENVARPKTEGFHPWTMDEVERFRARWPSGTRERRALEILLFTGLRRGEAPGGAGRRDAGCERIWNFYSRT
jgi:integrase